MQPTGIHADATPHLLHDETDFSLAIGGPLYQLYLRTKLARPVLELVTRRVTCISLICWLPLLLLALIAGNVFGGVSIPFLLDIGVHARFLLAVPLLIGAELIVHERSSSIVRQFLSRGIISERERVRFDDLVTSTMKLRNSVLVEVVLAVSVIIFGYWVWSQGLTPGVSTWYAVKADHKTQLTAAGYWYLFVSSSVVRFLILRWYFRILLWYQFLWRVRGLELHLNLFHPDRAAGLGFLEESVIGFAPVMVAQTVLAAGVISDRIWHAGAILTNFKIEIVAMVIFLMLLVLTPLGFFIVQLEHAARAAKREYGLLATHYVEDFHSKWIQEHGAGGEDLLGTSDIQSLADLGNAYSVVNHMRLLPFGKEAVIRLAIIIILPLLPLTLTMVSLETIVERLVKFVF